MNRPHLATKLLAVTFEPLKTEDCIKMAVIYKQLILNFLLNFCELKPKVSTSIIS